MLLQVAYVSWYYTYTTLLLQCFFADTTWILRWYCVDTMLVLGWYYAESTFGTSKILFLSEVAELSWYYADTTLMLSERMIEWVRQWISEKWVSEWVMIDGVSERGNAWVGEWLSDLARSEWMSEWVHKTKKNSWAKISNDNWILSTILEGVVIDFIESSVQLHPARTHFHDWGKAFGLRQRSAGLYG